MKIFTEKYSDHRRGLDGNNEMEVRLDDLAGNMMLSRDLRTVSGRLMMPKNSHLNVSAIERIKSNQLNDPVIDGFFVYRAEYAGHRRG